jgi:hypothetical protein
VRKRLGWTVAAAALAVAAAVPASAKDKDKDSKKTTPLRYQHTWAEATEEAKARGCVIFANFHIDH